MRMYVPCECCREYPSVHHGKDAEFIVHARADVPALLDEVERLTKDRDDAIATVNHAYREGGALYLAHIAQAEAEEERDEARAEVRLLRSAIDTLANVARGVDT